MEEDRTGQWHFGTKYSKRHFGTKYSKGRVNNWSTTNNHWINCWCDYPYITDRMTRSVIELGMRVTDHLELENGHVY